MSKNLIEIENLEVAFKTSGGSLKAVSDVSFKMEAGETLGIVGESGSGKSVVSLSIMGLIPNPPGKISRGKIKSVGKKSWMVQLSQLRCQKTQEVLLFRF